jgi:hypothetical protein
MRSRTSVCQRVALVQAEVGSSARVDAAQAQVVLLMIGNSATSVAQITIAGSGS